MDLGSLLQAPGQLASSRFFRVAYLPTCAGVVFILVLIWAGAPGHRVRFSNAWHGASHLGIGEIVLLALGVTLAAVVVQPFQLAIVRVLEGTFPRWLGQGAARRWQLACKHRIEAKVHEATEKAGMLEEELGREQGNSQKRALRDEYVHQAGTKLHRLRSRFPLPDYLVRATGLGNALAAIEDVTGSAYGLDPVVTWPRLYPLVGDQVRASVDDARDSMDAAARLAATGAVAAVTSFWLLIWHSGWWTTLALAPLAVAVLAYLGTIPAAIGYGIALQAAFDLYRFDLLRALHLDEPQEQVAEMASNEMLSDFFRQGVPVPFSYVKCTQPAGAAEAPAAAGASGKASNG